jgi:hypothetical protein
MISKFILEIQKRRIKNYVNSADSIGRDKIFSSFSISYCLSILALLAFTCYLLLESETVVLPLIIRWVEIFKIQEIFELELFTERFIREAYRVFILLILVLISIKIFLRLLKYIFSLFVLSNDRLIIIESNFFKSRIHHIPYGKISRLSATETFVHKTLKLGNIEILAGQRELPLKFGPIPHFPSFITQLTSLIQKR